MRYLFALLLFLPAAAAFAQIYQYVDPTTGSKKFTNLQPNWYSTDHVRTGPRTLLIINGQVADDTGKKYDPDVLNWRVEQAAEYYEWVEARQAQTHAEVLARAQIHAQARAARESAQAKSQAFERDAAEIKFRRQVQASREGREVAVRETTKKDVAEYRKQRLDDPARRFEQDVEAIDNERRKAQAGANQRTWR